MDIDIFPRIGSLRYFAKTLKTVPQKMLAVKRVVGRISPTDLDTRLRIMSKYAN